MGRRLCWFLVAAAVLTVIAVPAFAGGHWVLAFWRSMGKDAASSNHYVRVWTFDENGNVKGNIPINNAYGIEVCKTETSGRADFAIDVGNEYQCKVGQAGTTSDISPYMSSGRYPEWGHYSYELGFMYKSDINNSGAFDQTILGGAVPRKDSTTSNAPCTASMAYYSFDPSDWDCDVNTKVLPAWGEHGQTFIPTANRVACVMFHPTVGGNNTPITFTVEIREGGPTGAVIATKTSTQHMNQDWWVVPFGTTSCAVTPGATYFARVYTAGDFNAYYVNRTFGGGLANGQAYWRANSASSWSIASNPGLFGFIVCANSSKAVYISGVTPTTTTGSATINWTTDVASTSRIDYGTTSSYGQYIYDATLTKNHSVTISNLHGGTIYNFKLKSTATGYDDGITADATFATVSANTNLMTNGGFETAQLSPWIKFGQFSNNQRADGLGPWCTDKCPIEGHYDFVSICSYGTLNGGAYQRVSNVVSGATYSLLVNYYTRQTGGANSDVANQIGIDPYGGIDQNSVNIVWSPMLSSQDTWTVASLSAVAKSNRISIFLKAIQSFGLQWNINGFDNVILTGPAGGSVTSVKGMQEGTMVSVAGKVVTATAGQIGAYYLQETGNKNGIRVETISGTVNVGNLANATGWLKTENGEKVIFDATITNAGSSTAKAIAMTNKLLGGKSFNSTTLGETGAYGVNNVAVLVRTTGKVTSKSGTDFYITDGSDSPIKCDSSALGTTPNLDDYVVVTGICRLLKSGSNYVPYVKLRTTGDWRKVN